MERTRDTAWQAVTSWSISGQLISKWYESPDLGNYNWLTQGSNNLVRVVKVVPGVAVTACTGVYQVDDDYLERLQNAPGGTIAFSPRWWTASALRHMWSWTTQHSSQEEPLSWDPNLPDDKFGPCWSRPEQKTSGRRATIHPTFQDHKPSPFYD